ncbi:hypothetical protein DUNSADRAFT_908 [Dunaliella salina]|uniref:Encoded protein n=1 Tax=Dunaliella salina TaxID=3046 RepID=A0ABQ7H8Q6_DUNSA|nr:hypothetical protein DUNSADRAFT_908 [Dunaliella salina]|eukprot:KAF5843233.1 hypothetical protein DUNSADRAFT_908 [Dunaliella salina]
MSFRSSFSCPVTVANVVSLGGLCCAVLFIACMLTLSMPSVLNICNVCNICNILHSCNILCITFPRHLLPAHCLHAGKIHALHPSVHGVE